MATPVEINHILVEISHYYQYPLPYSASQVYIDCLKDFPVEALFVAARRHIKESPYFPQVDELRMRAAQAGSGSAGSASSGVLGLEYPGRLDSFQPGEHQRQECTACRGSGIDLQSRGYLACPRCQGRGYLVVRPDPGS